MSLFTGSSLLISLGASRPGLRVINVSQLCPPCPQLCHRAFPPHSHLLYLNFTSVPKSAEIHRQLDSSTSCLFPKEQMIRWRETRLNSNGKASQPLEALVSSDAHQGRKTAFTTASQTRTVFQRLGHRRKGTDIMTYKIQVKTHNFLSSVSIFPVGHSTQALLQA